MVATLVEELPDNKVRLTVDVPGADVHHAVEHAASDLAEELTDVVGDRLVERGDRRSPTPSARARYQLTRAISSGPSA